jgi:ATP-binding cassette subfamily C protein CydC
VPAKTQDFASGDLLNRALGDVDTLENFYVRVVAPYMAAGLTIIGMGLFISQFDARMGVVLTAGMFLSGAVIPLLAYRIGNRRGRDLVQQTARLSSDLVESLQGIADLTAANRSLDASSRLIEITNEIASTQKQSIFTGAWTGSVNSLLTNLTMVGILWLGIPLVTSGRLEGFLLPVVVMLTLASFEAVTPLVGAAQKQAACLQAGERLFELAEIQPETVEPIHPAPFPPPPLRMTLENVSLHYETDSEAALAGINLNIEEGEHIAVIGASGAGKTSLTNLLLRLWDYDSGRIVLNQVDYRTISQAGIRENFSIISQSTYFFSTTLRQNLRLARPGADDEAVFQALAAAGLAEWAAGLPEGLDTWIGEHGYRLSGGERQRLAVARAILRDTRWVILDEPTNNLDAVTEMQLIDHLHKVLKDKTVIWITHRLAGLDWMDRIYVLQDGRLLESGTHCELKTAGGYYARLLDLQNQMLPFTFSLPRSS